MARSRAQVLGKSTLPVFFTVTYALVTSPIPCKMSMLVLQPRISTARDVTSVMVGVSVGVTGVNVGSNVDVGADVTVAIGGVVGISVGGT